MSDTPESEATTSLRRDEKGRPIAEDGYPISGLAHVKEVVGASSLSPSTIYAGIADGSIPSRPFGRARRVEWGVVRRLFLTPLAQD